MKGIRIFKGKLTDEQREELKEMFPGTPLFYTVSEDRNKQQHHVVFRPIFPELYHAIQTLVQESRASARLIPQMEVDRRIFEECLVWPHLSESEIQELEVQVIPNFSTLVQKESGFAEVDIYGNWIGMATNVLPIKDYDYWQDIAVSEIEELKSSTSFALKRLRIGKWKFVIRPLTTQDVMIAQTQSDVNLSLARSTVMWPGQETIDWSVIPAGVVERIGTAATQISQWDVEDVVIEEL